MQEKTKERRKIGREGYMRKLLLLSAMLVTLSGCSTLGNADFWAPAGRIAMRDSAKHDAEFRAKIREFERLNPPRKNVVGDDVMRVNLTTVEVAPGVKVIQGTID